MRSALEAQLGFKIPVAHPVVAWLVSHSANILTWFVKGNDGRTPYHRVRGRPFNGKLLQFGEFCRYRCRAQEPVHGGHKWSAAIYLGRERHQDQHVPYDDKLEKAVFARTVMRVPNAEKWRADAVAAVSALPWSLHEPLKPDVVFQDPAARPDQVPADHVPAARRVYLKPELV